MDKDLKQDILKYAGNVAIFPFFKNAPQDKEGILDELIHFYMDQFIIQMENHGIDIYSDEFERDFNVAIEFMKCAFYKTEQYPHFLETTIDQIYKILSEAKHANSNDK